MMEQYEIPVFSRALLRKKADVHPSSVVPVLWSRFGGLKEHLHSFTRSIVQLKRTEKGHSVKVRGK